jgi:DNA-binding HxlR family transcriptional regulator
MTRTSLESFNCSLARALDILGDKWAMLIVRDAFYGVSSFSNFQRRLGMARNVLTDRLNVLVEGGVLERATAKPGGDRLVYRLTQQGKELFPVLVGLTQWGDKWIHGPGKEPVRILDAEGGAPVQPVCVLSRDNRYLEAGAVAFVAGPGANEATRAQFKTAAREPIPDDRSS